MVSPLTPALSPLRGEGARQAVLFQATLRAASPAFWLLMQSSREGSERGEGLLYLDARPARTPSPLNGERAGVRGEMARCAPPSRVFDNGSWVTVNWLLAFLGAMLFICTARASIDIVPLQQRLNQGQALEVRKELDQALSSSPENPHLLYNRAVASYAAGLYEEALLDLDLVESARPRSLANKARFQKGNAEFRLGLNTSTNDLEATISRWKQSVASYESALKEQPNHAEARRNQETVRKLLKDLLMKTAKENLERGQQMNQPADRRIPQLRSAMEQFHDVTQMEPQDQEAKDGEQQAKDLLAKALDEEGTRKTLANQMVMPAPNEPMMMRPDVKQIQEGVNMLEDATALKPEDKQIAQHLEEGRERLANALTLQAQIYLAIEPRIPRVDDKLGILRMALENVEKALEQKPDHQQAKQVMEQVKQRLAQLHEQQGDQMDQRSENAPLEQQAQDLSTALDHFQQASALQPQQQQLPQKAKKTQEKLEQALEQLGDKLMKKPGDGESLDEEAMRLQGAEQALNELQGLKPSKKTGEKAQQVSEELGKVRQKLGEKGQPEIPQPGGPGQPPMPTQPQNDPQSMPMDAPPKLDTPGAKGPYQSPAMNRNLRDY